jgi:hypothetical protein
MYCVFNLKENLPLEMIRKEIVFITYMKLDRGKPPNPVFAVPYTRI